MSCVQRWRVRNLLIRAQPFLTDVGVLFAIRVVVVVALFVASSSRPKL
jgi:hypothetical protein